MTTPDESAVDGLASVERDARERPAPARLHEPIAQPREARAHVGLTGQRAPGRLTGRARTTEVDEPCTQPRRRGKHRASRKRVYVELEGVSVVRSTPRALVVDDVDRTVRPHDDEVHAAAQHDRPTLRIVDAEDERRPLGGARLPARRATARTYRGESVRRARRSRSAAYARRECPLQRGRDLPRRQRRRQRRPMWVPARELREQGCPAGVHRDLSSRSRPASAARAPRTCSGSPRT